MIPDIKKLISPVPVEIQKSNKILDSIDKSLNSLVEHKRYKQLQKNKTKEISVLTSSFETVKSNLPGEYINLRLVNIQRQTKVNLKQFDEETGEEIFPEEEEEPDFYNITLAYENETKDKDKFKIPTSLVANKNKPIKAKIDIVIKNIPFVIETDEYMSFLLNFSIN